MFITSFLHQRKYNHLPRGRTANFFRLVGDESFFQEIFNKVILDLKEKTKEKEHKRKEEKAKNERKDKERKEKCRKSKDRRGNSRRAKERRKIDETDSDGSDSYSLEETKFEGQDQEA